MSNNYGFEPTLDGLNNIAADSTTTTDIICDNLTVNVSGTAPTMPALDNSTHLATTAYVNTHTSATYVTIGNPPQIITGEKTFSNANTFISGLIKDSSGSANSIELDDGSASHYLNLTSDHMALASSGSMSLTTGAYFVASGPYNFYFRNPSGFGNNLIIDDNNGASGALTLKIDSSIPFANISSSYQLDLNPDPIKSLNLGTGLTTGSVNISTGTTVNAPITIGSITSSTQTATHNAISTFSKIPSCAVAPTSGNHLCNYTYVNSVISGPSILPLNNFWSGYNTFNLDVSLNSKLFVIGDVSFNSKLFVGGDVSMNSKLFVSSDASFNSKLFVGSDVSFNSKLFVSSDASFNSKMFVGSDASFNSKLFVASDVSFNSKLFLGGDASFNSKLFVGSDASFNSKLFVASDVSFNSKLFVASDASFNSKLFLGSDASFNSKLFVASDASFNSKLFLGGDASFNSKLFLSSDASFNSRLSVAGDVSFNSNLNIVGNVVLNASSDFTFIPTGTINTSVVSTVPTGFLYCNGDAVLRSTYARLFTAIGTVFGVGNGTTTFNVPNFIATFLRGAGSKTVILDTYTAEAVGTLQLDMALTTPKAGYSTPIESTGYRSAAAGARDCLARTNQGDPAENATGLDLAYPAGRGGTEVRPLNMAVYYYIKY